MRKVNTSGTISTIAGNGTAGYSGDGGAATSAELDYPSSIAVDSSGNIFVSDEGNSVIRKINTSGAISTVAGDGTSGYAGDGGSATSAELNQASEIAIGSSGNVYIADSGNNVVRKVNTSGTISTIAGNGTAGYSGDGGAATSAELKLPSGVAVDSSGDVYIADRKNYVIREVSSSTGDISTVAGNGTLNYSGDGGGAKNAELSFPTGEGVDSSGNIYFVDTGDNVVREVNVTSGNISTVAGNGVAGYSGDGAVATSARLNSPAGLYVDSSNNIFVADSGNSVIRKVTASSGDISTVAGNGTSGYSGDGGSATSAELNDPLGVFVDSSNDILIADSGNNVVREVTTGGVIATVAGGPGTGTATSVAQVPSGVAFAGGYVYVSDSTRNVVRKINLTGGGETILAGNGGKGYSGDGAAANLAQLDKPEGLAIDGSGNVLVADTGNNVVRKVNIGTGNISTVAGTGQSGYTGDGGSATSARLYRPSAVAVDSSGNVYVADSGNNVVREVSASTGYISTIGGDGVIGYSGDGGLATSAELNNPEGLILDGSSLLVADTNNDVVRQITFSSGDIATIAGTAGLAGYSGDGGSATSATMKQPMGLVMDSSGNLYISDRGNSVLRKVVMSSGTISTFAGNGSQGYSGDGGSATSAKLSVPSDVTVDSSGDVILADTGNDRVRMISSGAISTLGGNGDASYSGDGGSATSGEFGDPTAIAKDASGNIYVADSGNNVVREFTISGNLSTSAGTGTSGYTGDGGAATSAKLNQPLELSLGNGGLFISDSGNQVIRFVNLSSGAISTFAGNGHQGSGGDAGVATSAKLNGPIGIVYDANGNLWICDSGNSRIRMVSGGGAL